MAFLDDDRRTEKFIPRHLMRPATPVVRLPQPWKPPPMLKPKIGRPRKKVEPRDPNAAPVNPDPITDSHVRSVKEALRQGRELPPLEPFIADEIVVEPGQKIDLVIDDIPRVRSVIAATLSASGMTHALLVGPSRAQDVVVWRMAAMYVARKMTRASLPQIGKHLRRDHSTVLHGVRSAGQPLVAACVIAILDKLNVPEARDANA